MHTSQVLILVACIAGFDLLIVPMLIGAVVRSAWMPMADRYPAVEPALDAVRREFQSFNSGPLNLGGCVHVAVDDAYLHLRPAWVARRLGVAGASVPWGQITLKRVGTRNARVRIESVGIELAGPRWCLELAGREVSSTRTPGR